MTSNGKGQQLKIRRARSADAPRLAELTTELGYRSTSAQLRQRLRRISPATQNAVFVAEAKDAGVVGWLHVSKQALLESDIRAEVNGLVVKEGHRSLGAGALLLAAAEDWARRRGCQSMSVRSNVIRERAHQFYERNGYEHYKTQKSFRKPL
jgi:GNAT superfamily N-acetyltransferase